MTVFAHFLWGFVGTAVEQIRQAQSYADKVPFTIALGIYFLAWLPFGILCLPLLLIGFVGGLLAQNKETKRGGPTSYFISRVYGIYIEDKGVKVDILFIAWRSDGALIVDFLQHNETDRAIEVDLVNVERFFIDDLYNQYDSVSIFHYNPGWGGRNIPPGAAIRYSVAFNAPDRPPGSISLVFKDSHGKRSFPSVECDWEWEREGRWRPTRGLKRTPAGAA